MDILKTISGGIVLGAIIVWWFLTIFFNEYDPKTKEMVLLFNFIISMLALGVFIGAVINSF